MASDGKLLFETGIDNRGFTADLGKINGSRGGSYRGNRCFYRSFGSGDRHRHEL